MPAETKLRARIAHAVARRYVAGETLEQALTCAATIGAPYTLSYWDRPGEETRILAARWLELIETMAGRGEGGYVSLRLPPLGEEKARELARGALALGLPVHFDSHAESDADRTLALAHELAVASPPGFVGTSVPGSWSRSNRDLDRAQKAGLRVRIVKGQWPGDRDPGRGFLDLAARAARSGAPFALATHNPRLLAAALERGDRVDFELELLYGLPARHVHALAARAKLPMRVYIGYGYGWLPYGVETLRRSPRSAMWVARDLAASLLPRARPAWPC